MNIFLPLLLAARIADAVMSADSPPTLVVHPDARTRFHEVAVQTRGALQELSDPGMASPPKWLDSVFTEKVFTAADIIGPVRIRHGDRAVVRAHEGRRFGLVGDPANSFVGLCYDLWRAIRPKDVVSLPAVEKTVEEWVFGDTTDQLVDYCLQVLQDQVRRIRVWVPVANLTLETPFELGGVQFETIQAERLASWYTPAGTEEEHLAMRQEHLKKRRKQLQGYAVGHVALWAEKWQACTYALEAVGTATAMLRLYTTPVFTFERQSHVAPTGQAHKDTYLVILESEGVLGGELEGLLREDDALRCTVSTVDLDQNLEMGLADIGRLLNLETRTSFQERVLAALRLYSDSTLERRVETRLVLVLTALESLYLKNSSEPILHNVGERVAMVVANELEGRKTAIELFKRAYALRSRFVHHGQDLGPDQLRQLQEFLVVAWTALHAALHHADDYSDVTAFAQAIDDKKLAGR